MKKAPMTLQATGALGEQLSFIPPAPFCPSWPKKRTLAAIALKLLFEGRPLDHEDFIEVTSSWRLADVVFRLRLLGWPIETIDKCSPSCGQPDRVIALYKLPGQYIAAALAMMTGADHAK